MHIARAAAALLLFSLTACGAPSPSTPPVTAPTVASAPSAATGVGEPTDDNRAAYVDGLRAIDPGLVTNTDRAIRRGENICEDIAQGKDEATIVNNAAQRLSGGDATINEAQATRAVALARQHLCAAS